MDFSLLINISVGILASLVGGFFILQLILTAIDMATDYAGSSEKLKKAQQTLTSGIKGIVVTLGTILLLNFILYVLGVNLGTGGPVAYIVGRIEALEACLRNYEDCGE